MTTYEMIEGARQAYYAYCYQHGYIIYSEPCIASSEVVGNIVILRNSYRDLGRYILVKESPHSWFERV